jgi:hypothetical protein
VKNRKPRVKLPKRPKYSRVVVRRKEAKNIPKKRSKPLTI